MRSGPFSIGQNEKRSASTRSTRGAFFATLGALWKGVHRMFGALVPLVGALSTIMGLLNSRLSGVVGNLVAALVIHVVGLAAVQAVLLVKREPARPGRLPVAYYLGGFIGVGSVFSMNYTFATLGAALAVSLSLLGQTLFSVVADAVGFMGRKRYPLSARRLPGIALAVAGALLMAGNWRSSVVPMLVALCSGVFAILTFAANSELGLKKGTLRATRINYLVGLGTTMIIFLAVRPPVVAAAHAVAAASPLYILGGGIAGVGVVASLNVIFPRIPAFSATILMFSGQALTGAIIDFVAAGAFDARKLLGTLVLIAGLALNAFLSRRGGEKQGGGVRHTSGVGGASQP
jgi:bacterial/archaeal transporter family-2 protein